MTTITVTTKKTKTKTKKKRTDASDDDHDEEYSPKAKAPKKKRTALDRVSHAFMATAHAVDEEAASKAVVDEVIEIS